jgi:hypothetical protein
MKKHKAIDLIVVALTAIALLGVVGYARPLVISPIDNLETSNNSVLFSFAKADTIIIDDDMEFKTPMTIHAQDNLIVTLKPGKYYWKIDGALQSEVHELTILSTVDLRLRENGDEYDIVNGGNTKLSVDIYNNSNLTGTIFLESGESTQANSTLYVGREE